MRLIITFLAIIILLSPIYSITVDNRANVVISSKDLFEMESIVSETYNFRVSTLSIYYEKNTLIYEFSGYKTFKEGYATREVPYSIRLNENLDPVLIPVLREDNISYRAVFLGIPGIISYLFYKAVGLL